MTPILNRSRFSNVLKKPIRRIRNIETLRLLIAISGISIFIVIGTASTLAFNAPLRNKIFTAIPFLQTSKQPTTSTEVKLTKSTQNHGTPQTHTTTPVAPTTPNAPNTQPSTQAPIIKYKTSPDPMSDAWSSTPPGPSPTDINITITSPNQVPAGTKIISNAVKEYTVYYGGDLVFSTPTVVVHKSQSLNSAWLTVTTPDGDAMTAPADPWYITNPNSTVSFNGDPEATMVSWPIQFNVMGNLSVGTYQAHIFAWRSGGTGTLEWEYDGFETIDVEN